MTHWNKGIRDRTARNVEPDVVSRAGLERKAKVCEKLIRPWGQVGWDYEKQSDAPLVDVRVFSPSWSRIFLLVCSVFYYCAV